jgi:hypothetical protein
LGPLKVVAVGTPAEREAARRRAIGWLAQRVLPRVLGGGGRS